MITEIIENWDYIPANGNVLGRDIHRNDVVNVYGTDARAMHFRRHKVPGGTANRDFIYYMVSFDPAGLAWYHVSKKESTLIEVSDKPTGFINSLLTAIGVR